MINEKKPENKVLLENENKAPMTIKKRLALGISAAVLVCTLGLALPTLLEAIVPDSSAESPSESTQQASEAPAANASGLFTVTAYAAEWKETVLQPNVSVELNEYSPAQSDVPGLPFIISIPDENTGINADGIRVDVDTGSIVTWEPPDYTVRERGKTYVVSSGDTIYWSPLDAQGDAITRCEMTMTAYDGENEAYSARILISRTSDFQYAAELE